MLSLHIGGGCGQINLNYEHKPSYLIFYILTDEIWDQTGVCVRLCEWRQQRAPPWMNEHREGCNSSQPLPFLFNCSKGTQRKVTKHPHSWTLSTKTQALHWTTPRCITKPEFSIKSTENVIPMSTKAISPTSGKIHGTSHASQETQKIATTGNLTRHPKVIAWLIQEHLVGLSDNETHLSITQTCTVLSMLQNHTAYRQKTWNKSWANWTSSFKISWTRMTTKLSHARCDQRQNGRPMIAWYTTISEMTSTCSTTTQDKQVSHGQPLMETEVPENITSLTHHSLANC